MKKIDMVFPMKSIARDVDAIRKWISSSNIWWHRWTHACLKSSWLASYYYYYYYYCCYYYCYCHHHHHHHHHHYYYYYYYYYYHRLQCICGYVHAIGIFQFLNVSHWTMRDRTASLCATPNYKHLNKLGVKLKATTLCNFIWSLFD